MPLLHCVILNAWVVVRDSVLEHLENDFSFIVLKLTGDLGEIVVNSNGTENFDIQYYSFDHLIL